jgi:hypothetical protein
VRAVGSGFLWMMMRLTQLALFLCAMAAALLITSGYIHNESVILFLCIWCIGVALAVVPLHPYAEVFADETGVHYRRYFRQEVASWDRVFSIDFDSRHVTIWIKAESLLHQRVPIRIFRSGSDGVLETVNWMRSHLRQGAVCAR